MYTIIWNHLVDVIMPMPCSHPLSLVIDLSKQACLGARTRHLIGQVGTPAIGLCMWRPYPVARTYLESRIPYQFVHSIDPWCWKQDLKSGLSYSFSYSDIMFCCLYLKS